MFLTRAILNSGNGAWAFDGLAAELARVLWVEVLDHPADLVYLLGWDGEEPPTCKTFIPFESVQIAADKRLQAQLFAARGLAVPRTHLLESHAEVARWLEAERGSEWVLKYPIGCGASGHRLLREGEPLPKEWPRPYVVQEFMRLERPEVYRLYGVAGETFGWNVRRFPSGTKPSPWVAHARGARYARPEGPPAEAEALTREALTACGLWGSFGCVDLLRTDAGRWLVLEVGTDGVFNHVDRSLDLPDVETELSQRLAEAFWADNPTKPWGSGSWKTRTEASPAGSM